MADSSEQARRSGGSSTSCTLLERLKLDDDEAWRDLVRLYSPLIVYWCQKQGLPQRDCEDLLQDVFRTVVTNVDKFRKDRATDTFRGWLRSITRSRIIDHYRRHAQEPDPTGGTEATRRLGQLVDPIDDAEIAEVDDHTTAEQELFLRAVMLIRDDFQNDTWQAFWRTAVDGLSATDAAHELGMRPGTVRVAKSRVLQRLRNRLGDLLD